MVSLCLGFYILNLPRVYGAGWDPSKITVITILAGLVKAPIKSIGPFVGVFLLCVNGRDLRSFRKVFPFLLLSFVFIYLTLFKISWGYFDSWFYLHQPIAFVAAWIIGLSWGCGWNRWQLLGKRIILILGILYGSMAALNGSANLKQFVSEAETLMRNLCMMKTIDHTTKIFTNCDEAGHHLNTYISAGNVCSLKKPILEDNRLTPENMKTLHAEKNVFFLVSSKCLNYDSIKQYLEEQKSPSLTQKYWAIYFKK